MYQWDNLLIALQEKKCTPFIGAGASAEWVPVASLISNQWAQKYDYPFHDSHDLPKVAEFLAIEKEDDLLPKMIISREFKMIKLPDFSLHQYRNTPPAVLADLNLPVYITTNYDLLLEHALMAKGKRAITEFCRWNNYARAAEVNSIFEDPKFTPTAAKPLVYHLHGEINTPESLVLTETDYIDFIVSLIKDEGKNVLPPIIRKALTLTTLLFIGYRLEDINFRVIFQFLMDSLGSKLRSRSTAVLLPPNNEMSVNDKALQYLDRRNNRFKIDTYWGDSTEFCAELLGRFYGTVA
jgi:hypothetical protein